MGKNLPAKKYKVGNRTERFLQYTLDCAAGNDSHFIDLAAGISAVNKRFYRQGLYYYIKSIQVVETTQNSTIKFGTAPDTWMIPQSWKLGFRNWSKLNSMAAEGIPGGDLAVASKYHDFKIYLNQNHRSDPDVVVPTNGPESMDGSPEYNPDEWVYSKFNTLEPGADTPNNADRDSFEIMLLGSSHQPGAGGTDEFAAVSLQLSLLRSMDNTGETDENSRFSSFTEDPILNLFDSTTAGSDTLDDLRDDNDVAPYDANGCYVDTIMRAQAAVGPTSSSTAIMPGFCVPFGLLEVLTNCEGPNQLTILIEMAPGPYHGVYAERVV